MKGTIVAAAAAVLAGGVSADHHRHAHKGLFEKRAPTNQTASTCVPTCTTIWTTITGEAGRMWTKRLINKIKDEEPVFD
jgi:hypothetical protein